MTNNTDTDTDNDNDNQTDYNNDNKLNTFIHVQLSSINAKFYNKTSCPLRKFFWHSVVVGNPYEELSDLSSSGVLQLEVIFPHFVFIYPIPK